MPSPSCDEAQFPITMSEFNGVAAPEPYVVLQGEELDIELTLSPTAQALF